MFKNKIVCGDAVEEMRKIPDEAFDLVVTSPPYNLRNSTSSSMHQKDNTGRWKNAALKDGYDGYDDNKAHEDYVVWQRDCLTEMLRVIKDDGAIFYNHKWRVQGGLLQDRQDIVKDFPVRQIIIWQRNGGINFNQGYFLPTYEVIYLIAKKNFKLVNNALGYGDVWNIGQERKNKHPAAFPLELVDRIISSTYAKNVLDPFMGSGTTALAAKRLKIDYYGIEKSQKYCDMAESRLSRVMDSF